MVARGGIKFLLSGITTTQTVSIHLTVFVWPPDHPFLSPYSSLNCVLGQLGCKDNNIWLIMSKYLGKIMTKVGWFHKNV